MSSENAAVVLLLCRDLMFRIELKDLLRAHGCTVLCPKNPSEDLSNLDLNSFKRVLVDLETIGDEHAALLERLGTIQDKVLCFYSHRNVGALGTAHSFGLEQVVPRSALQDTLAEFLSEAVRAS